MTRRKKLRLMALLLLAVGLGMLLFPAASQKVYAVRAAATVRRFDARLSELEGEQAGRFEELYRAMTAYNRELYESGQAELTDPFSYELVGFSLKAFGLEEEMVGHLSIPRLDLLLPVCLGASTDNMAKGAAHLTQTSLPVGGEDTNAVICAHRGMGTAVMFRDLHLLEAGDRITLTNFRETLVYEVAGTAVIEPYQIDQILIQPGRDMITLLTCHPYGYNYQRYVVYCTRAA